MANRDTTTIKNFAIVFVSLLLIIFLGVVGYSILEGFAFLDALYMTFITFSTVGYQEIGPLTIAGRIFTMFLILFGLVVISMLSASVTSLLVRRELLSNFKTKRMKKQIQSFKGHTILCGAGETGKTVIEEFVHARKKIVVIEERAEVIEWILEQYPKLLVVQGDATKDEVLVEANIQNASSLITALSEDTDNLFVVISACSIKPDLLVISRAVDAHTAGKMYKAGATHVISPNLTEGMRMAAVVLRPNVVSFLDVAMRDQEMSFRLEEVTVPRDSVYHKKSLRELEIPQRTGLIVIAIRKEEKGESKFIFNPQSSTVIKEGDKLIVLGDIERVEKLHGLLHGRGLD